MYAPPEPGKNKICTLTSIISTLFLWEVPGVGVRIIMTYTPRYSANILTHLFFGPILFFLGLKQTKKHRHYHTSEDRVCTVVILIDILILARIVSALWLYKRGPKNIP